MGRVPLPLLALLGALALAALVATGCGSDRSNLIPSSRASDLVSQLSALQSQIQAGECTGLTAKVTAFHDDATSLPNSVDRRLRTRINEGAKSLQAHASKTCQDQADANAERAQEEQTQTDTTTTETTTTDTSTTPTTTTDTTPTTTTTTPTTPTDTTTTPSPSGTSPGGTGAPSDTSPGDTGGTGDGSDGSDGSDGGTG